MSITSDKEFCESVTAPCCNALQRGWRTKLFVILEGFFQQFSNLLIHWDGKWGLDASVPITKGVQELITFKGRPRRLILTQYWFQWAFDQAAVIYTFYGRKQCPAVCSSPGGQHKDEGVKLSRIIRQWLKWKESWKLSWRGTNTVPLKWKCK